VISYKDIALQYFLQ